MILDRLKHVQWLVGGKKLIDIVAFCKGNPFLILLLTTGAITFGTLVYLLQKYREQLEKPLEVRVNHRRASVLSNGSRNLSTCLICKEKFDSSMLYTLPCGHSGHDECLFAKIIMEISSDLPHGKCVDDGCQYKLCRDDLLKLSSIFERRYPNCDLNVEK